jgi:hypothetical protein
LCVLRLFVAITKEKAGGHCWSPVCELKPRWLSTFGDCAIFYLPSAIFNASGLRRGFGFERVLGDLDQFAKGAVVLRCQVGNDLAVERDLRGF